MKTFYCPKCNREVKEEEKFCYNCGEHLEKRKEIVCSICGKGLQTYEKFCTACGKERPSEDRV